ncbi:hypothetical protein I5G61_gp59 [Mycobacterium phage Quesadilla]|uniref:Uncharacterized protein n=1 Tax=Mycobacterium phage Quesadilla TaxID=2664226 RepID=A0A5Q2WFL8_9CAUD|nr:hypothetical protein I5G61_gp59 [Mycobacterium phage Quesadilla]QGH75307.1 hypothetical protein SEA_QUESADILLA_59 [Mycobacterium phage Quesadilla]
MSTPSGMIRDERHLATLPDGTIISWQRIVGDPTSEAVAFIRREIEDGHAVVWVSPGGWSPHTIEEAGVTFPAQVIRLGTFNPDHYLPSELPVLGEALAEVTGGTWGREKALECAARLFAGTAPVPFEVEGRIMVKASEAEFEKWLSQCVLRAAENFETWLDREVVPTPPAGDGPATMAGVAMEGE